MNGPISAIDQVLMSIDELLAGQDDKIILPLTTLNTATTTLVDKNAKIVTRLMEKILKHLDKATTKNLDALDSVYTSVLAGLDDWQFNVNFLLSQLAAKGGFTEAGEPLEAALDKNITDAAQLTYTGTLVLAIHELKPFLIDLIEVLREIRDRMPPQSIRVVGEKPAEAPTEGPDAGSEWITEDFEEAPLSW